jgi:capsular exopolysaccharide synthesis family protein
MADVDHPAQVILITSSIPGEGKSTLSQSLAFSADQADQRVLLIDGDLRHPSLSKYFGLDGKLGLVDLLTGSAKFEDIAFQHGNLTILPAGTKSQNPPDLLGSERMRLVVEQLRSMYEYIIIDTSPTGPVIDAKILSALADKVVFAVRFHGPARELVAEQVDFFARNHKLAGIALTLVDETKAPRYGAYSHYSGYYYKKYYHN